MNYFPLFLKLQHKPCLVVGGGHVAYRKVKALLQSGAFITIQAPRLCDELSELTKRHPITWFAENFQQDDTLNSYFLVVAATSDPDCNQRIADHCAYIGLHCNVTSQAEEGDALLPAILDRSPITIALHSDSHSPILTRYLKRQLEGFLPAELGKLGEWAEKWRLPVKQQVTDSAARRRFWDRLFSGSAATHAMSGRTDAADAVIQKHLQQEAKSPTGEVYLVGAGPGDPELLTLRALRLMRQADVVLYDRLVSEPVLKLLPDDCERIYVGKQKSQHSMPQTAINQLLVDYARQGRNVIRLKGGDPFIFGRGGEEIDLLAQAEINFEVVPGITAANGCACYAGIPLTHRDHAQSVRFITGHLQDDKVNLDWPELARPQQTLVFYMGLSGLVEICSTLIDHGRNPDTPAALIEKGTMPQQQVVVAKLSNLASKIDQLQVSAPTLLIVGEVVDLHHKLAWYHRPDVSQ